MKALGRFLRSSLKGNFEPYFLIEDDLPGTAAQKIILTETMIRDMYQRGYFDIEPVRINASKEYTVIKILLCLQATPYTCGDTALSISGFPRQLMSEDSVNASKSHPYILHPIATQTNQSKRRMHDPSFWVSVDPPAIRIKVRILP